MNQNDTELLHCFLANEVSAKAFDQLMERLRHEPELVQTLLALATNEELISEWASRPHMPIVELDLVETRNTGQAQRSPREPESTWRRTAVFLSSSAALVMIGLLIFWWLSLPATIAKVRHTSNVVGLDQSFDWQTVRQGETLSFETGIIELTTVNQVSLVLEGPIHCQFHSRNDIELDEGRLFADVPETGRGLTIITPDGEVIDWGTKFGVEVLPEQKTEVHVFQGRVTAELKNGDDAQKADLTAGRAVLLSKQEEHIKDVKLSNRFARESAVFLEEFTYRGNDLAGHAGWFDSGLSPQRIRTDPHKSIQYPGLILSSKGMLVVKDGNQASWSPVGRRWHNRYFSMLIYPDDDFVKRLGDQTATLISFGSLDSAERSNVRLVVQKPNKFAKQTAEFGIEVNGQRAFYENPVFKGFHPCLVVMRLGEDEVDLWINPPSDSLGSRAPPPPSVTLPYSAETKWHALWINDIDNPGSTWYWIDSLRGGDNWANVTPRSQLEN